MVARAWVLSYFTAALSIGYKLATT